jgi:hypothetical protein
MCAEGMSPLEPLVGEWTMEMHVPVEPPAVVAGRVTFEWLPDHRFLIQRWTIEHEDAPDGIAVIGASHRTGEYTQHYFDSRGVERIYAMTLSTGELRLWREVDPAGDDFSQRFIGRMKENGDFIDGRWERSDDARTWELDFVLTYRRGPHGSVCR